MVFSPYTAAMAHRNTLYNHEIEDCATKHTGVVWWLHGKPSYWHFSTLKCLLGFAVYVLLLLYAFLKASVNFAICCYNQSCPIMHRQRGLRHHSAALQVKLLSKSRCTAEWILKIQELGSHMATWRWGVSQQAVLWTHPVTGIVFSSATSSFTFFLSLTLMESWK